MSELKDMQMSGASCLALNEIDEVLQKHFPDAEWNVEWRSVLGDDYWENPIWSLTIYVETSESVEKQEGLGDGGKKL